MRVLGPDDPGTLADMHGLAHCYRAMEDLAAALPLYQKARRAGERGYTEYVVSTRSLYPVAVYGVKQVSYTPHVPSL